MYFSPNVRASLKDAALQADSLFNSQLENFDVDNVISGIGAFTSFLNSVNCSNSPDCAALNRIACGE